ncbi:MAG: DUF3795 domain-containing protein [Candidatus Lokiarchaeota archaeon]|nr:DUF3795 domain-containing protein [Candidatus Lokiarchaeota archaeon]
MVTIKKELIAPCGLYCGVCAIHIADRDNNLKFKERLVDVYKPFSKTIEDIKCNGCLSEKKEDIFGYCQLCPIRDCIKNKGIEGCYQCDDFPCKFIENFPIPVGKKVIFRAIPRWREIGTEKWVEEEEKRYLCPECNNPLFRGTKRCNECGVSVDVD